MKTALAALTETAIANHTILVDVDGVLTDGKMYIDHTGEKMFKAFNSKDVRAIRELIMNGYRVVMVSADDHESAKHFANKVGAEFVHERDKSKLGPSFIAIGDDAWDRVMLENARFAFYPADTPRRSSWKKDMCHAEQLNTAGGQGIMAEIVELLIKNPEKFQ